MSIHDTERMLRTTTTSMLVLFGIASSLFILGAFGRIWAAAGIVFSLLFGVVMFVYFHGKDWWEKREERNYWYGIFGQRLSAQAMRFLFVLNRKRSWSFSYNDKDDMILGIRELSFWTFEEVLISRAEFEALAQRSQGLSTRDAWKALMEKSKDIILIHEPTVTH